MLPGSEPLRRAVLALVLIAAVGAVAVVVTDESASADGTENDSFPSGENVADRYAELDGVIGTMHQVTTRGNETNVSVRLIRARPGTPLRYVRTLNGTTDVGDVFASNRSLAWRYDSDENTATRMNSSFAGTRDRGEYVERLFARLDRTDVTPAPEGTETPGIAPVPRVPGGAAGVAANGTRFDVSYEGRATVAGREAYVLRVGTDDENESATDLTRTLWIDTEWYFILGHRIEGTLDGEQFHTNVTFSNVTFNPDFDPGAFDYEPPADATIERSGTPQVQSYESVAALQADTEMIVPNPDLPRDFAFSAGRYLTLNRSRIVSLRYGNATSTVTVSKANRSFDAIIDDANASEGEPVQVGDRNATYQSFDISTVVRWECDGRGYSVRGRAIPRDLLLDIAESVECD